MAFGLLAGLAGGVVKKLGGKAVRWATRQAVGRGAARTAAAGLATGAAATAVTRTIQSFAPSGRGSMPADQGFGPDLNPFGTNERTGAFFGFGGKRRYRRMNYLNQRALKKSIRRVQGFEKIVRQAFSVSKGSLQLKKRRSS